MLKTLKKVFFSKKWTRVYVGDPVTHPQKLYEKIVENKRERESYVTWVCEEELDLEAKRYAMKVMKESYGYEFI